MSTCQKKKIVKAQGKKSIRTRENLSDDDDFDSSPPVKRTCTTKLKSGLGESSRTAMKRKPTKKHVTVTSSPKGKGRKKEFPDDISFPRLAYRTCPLVLVDAMQNMTERQKNDAIAMGFGSVLTIKVKDIPTQLGYWVLDNFDPVSCEIKLQNDRLRITSEDVYRVLGLPKGTKPIRRKEKNEQVESYKKWISGFSESEYGVLKYGAKPSDVKKDMLKQNECGEVFRRHFMVLLNHCLIESCSSGYVKPQIMDCFEDVSNLEDWDWCDYIKSRLVKHRINWEKNKNNDFYGPILFLTALYLDRVEIFGLGVPRKFPTIRNWMPGDMKKRQKSEIAAGGFGAGYLYKTSEVPVIMDPPTPSKHTNESENRCSAGDMDKYADCFISKAKNIASLMLELVCMIEKAPPNIAQSESFKVIINATQKLCAFNPNDCSTSNEPTQSQFTFFNSDCEFWREAYRITAMAEIENAVIRRNDFIRSSQPSFRPGILTQEFGVKGEQIQVAQTDNNTTPNTENEHNNEEIAGPPSLNDHCSEPDLHHEKENLVMDEKIHKICMEIEKIDGAKIEDAVTRQNDFIESSQPSFSLGILTQEFGVKGDQIQVAHTDNNTTPNIDNEIDSVDTLVRKVDASACVKGKEVVEKPVQGATYEMVKRSKKTMQKPTLLWKPHINIHHLERLTKDERVLGFWVTEYPERDDEVIFSMNGELTLTRRELKRLCQREFVSSKVVDAWSIVKNKSDKLHGSNLCYLDTAI